MGRRHADDEPPQGATPPREPPPRHPPQHLVVGRLGKPFGLRGAVYVVVDSDDPRRFDPGSRLLLDDGTALTVRRLHEHGDRTVVSFDEVADRTTAEALRGRELVVPVQEIRQLDADEYWDHDLVGCDVTTTTGDGVGRVTAVLHLPANDVLEVDDGTYLVPLIRDVVHDVDVAGRRIVIRAIPGLLDEG